mmetsp:Transcript_111002/g.220792  ORF Transcript_111002/g.220792 Transcript_111002/m.220792 type:complete len:162 (-) Transcript_111002:21-506(-)
MAPLLAPHADSNNGAHVGTGAGLVVMGEVLALNDAEHRTSCNAERKVSALEVASITRLTPKPEAMIAWGSVKQPEPTAEEQSEKTEARTPLRVSFLSSRPSGAFLNRRLFGGDADRSGVCTDSSVALIVPSEDLGAGLSSLSKDPITSTAGRRRPCRFKGA